MPERNVAADQKSQKQTDPDQIEKDCGRVGEHYETVTPEREPSPHRAVVPDAARTAHDPFIDSEPWEKAGNQEEDEIGLTRNGSPWNHHSEDEPVERDEAQGLEHGPGDTEGRAGET